MARALSARYTRAMKKALTSATLSPDPSTQNGAALLITGNHRILSAENTFPMGISQRPERLERPLKYKFIEHAERSVLYRAARRGCEVRGATLVSPWAACTDCARAIICTGVVTLVRFPLEGHGQWVEDVAIGDAMLHEAGVNIVEYDFPELKIPPILRNGELWNPRKVETNG